MLGALAAISAIVVATSGEETALLSRAGDQSGNVATPMGKVVELLGKLEKQVQMDGEKDATLFSASQKWYYKEVEKSERIIKESKASIEELTTTLAEQKAFRAAKSKALENTAASLASAQKDLKMAAERREVEHADFVKSEAALVDSIDELTRALAVTKKQRRPGAALVEEGGDEAASGP